MAGELDNAIRHWRMKKARYGLVGDLCGKCSAPTFPPHDTCSRCELPPNPKVTTNSQGIVFDSRWLEHRTLKKGSFKFELHLN